MRKTIIQLLEYGWPDKIISNYLMVKPTIVKYYRKKHQIYRNEYQGFYWFIPGRIPKSLFPGKCLTAQIPRYYPVYFFKPFHFTGRKTGFFIRL